MKTFSWRLCVAAYLVAYLTTVLGTALSLFLWAAPFDTWHEIWPALLWTSPPYAVPLALILGIAWNKRPRRVG